MRQEVDKATRQATAVLTITLLIASLLVGASVDWTDPSEGRAAETRVETLLFKVQAGDRSFDETVWLTLEQLAARDGEFPGTVRRLDVNIEPAAHSGNTIRITVDREDLTRMAKGEITYSAFIRDHVRFD